MKLAIVGSRDFNDYDLLLDIIDKHFDYYFVNKELSIISGGARGADSLGRRFAFVNELHYLEFPADWNKLGKSAGYIRNQKIVDECDMVLAFWDGESKGTQHTIDLAKKAKKPTFIVYF